MKKYYFSIAFLIASTLFVHGQKTSKYTISGQIKDAASGEDLISASIFAPVLGIGTSSNEYGFYSLTLDAGKIGRAHV